VDGVQRDFARRGILPLVPASQPIPAELRRAPFTTSRAAQLGVSRYVVRGPEFRKLFRGVWAHVDLPDTLAHRLAAVRLVLPDGAFICGLTAAWVYGIDVQDRRADLVWMGTRTGRRLRDRAGCMSREITVAAGDLQVLDGAYITTPLRTVFDCGRWLSLVEGTVVADALSHAGLVTAEELTAYAASHRGLRGIRTLDRVIDLMEPKAESPMETRVRLLLVLSGLPRPEAQIVLEDDFGFAARGDMGYRAEKLMIEYDGSGHWGQLAADERRRSRMRDLGWEVIVVTRDDYYKWPDELVARVAAKLRERRAPSPANRA